MNVRSFLPCLILLAACGSGQTSKDHDATTDPVGDDGFSDVCKTYLACAEKLAPETSAGLEGTLGEKGTCWGHGEAMASSCEMSCTRGIAALEKDKPGACAEFSGADAGAGSEQDAGMRPTEPGGAMRSVKLFDKIRISSHSEEPPFQKATAPLDFGAGPFDKVTFIADLDTTCYPFTKWADDKPPAGQNFPPKCDAFDRNFEFTIDEPAKDGEPPAFEIVRAITPFGGPEHIEVDITNLANARPGKHALQVFIATWSDAMGQVSGSDGGWLVSAHVEIHTGKPKQNVLAAIPLANTNLQMKTPALKSAPFKLPAGTKKALIELRSTGHGGGSDPMCFGPAEEFCVREHTLKFDGKAQPLAGQSPFYITRLDCDSLCTMKTQMNGDGTSFMYCAENPTGNIQSVQASRAGWCPGSMSPPLTWTLDVKDGATPKEHTFEYLVNHIADGGSMRVSAVVYALGE
jgi:hypothetical protein